MISFIVIFGLALEVYGNWYKRITLLSLVDLCWETQISRWIFFLSFFFLLFIFYTIVWNILLYIEYDCHVIETILMRCGTYNASHSKQKLLFIFPARNEICFDEEVNESDV